MLVHDNQPMCLTTVALRTRVARRSKYASLASTAARKIACFAHEVLNPRNAALKRDKFVSIRWVFM